MRPVSAPIAGLLFLLLFVIVCDLHAAVATTKHNLSVSGTGTIKATSETGICIFCHAPHNAAPDTALWNRRNPGSTYVPYSSSTIKSNPGQPNGGSLLCLSCHDGTIALGEVLSRKVPIAMAGGLTTLPAGPGRLGTDLSDDHPVSIAYTAALAAARGDLADPSTLTGRVKLDSTGQLQCSSCHDAHDDTNGKFLVMSNRGSALCITCHTKAAWTGSSHKTSLSRWNGAGANPFPNTSYTTVADNACESCHRQHSAGGKKWLLNAASEESNCYPCHNGNVASKNIQSEFNKASIHPVAQTTGVHDPSEPAVIASRHVECADCHNSHATNASPGPLPGNTTPISGSLHGVRGITINGLPVASAVYEYQVCFRCHADSPGQPPPRTTRQIVEPNIRKQFDPGNTSFHPVAAPGKASPVAGLIAPWTIASTMQCQDCHNNNAAASAGAGGNGPNGPHGSTFAPLLERRYDATGAVTESPAVYALCYKCHDRNTVLSETASKFPRHNKHVLDERTPCNVCHDPHGISLTGVGRPAQQQSGLLNFYVGPGTNKVTPSNGKLYADTVNRQCYMTCHGKDHNPCSYTNC